jgi:protein-L-isoaspartate(D-aspartate) O-methyltransferase
LHVKADNVRPGQTVRQLPMLAITFYDERRAIVGDRGIGPWRGSFAWQTERERIKVPIQAREAIVRIGLLGAVGEIAFDNVAVNPAAD